MKQHPHSGKGDLPDTDDSLAGQYVLGTLSLQERHDFEEQMARQPELQRAVHQWQEHFLSITDQLEPIPASPFLAARIERSLDAQGALAAKATTAKSMGGMRDFWNNLTIWRSCSAACLLLALVIGLQWQTSAPSVADPSYIAVLVTPEDKTPGWVIQTNQTDEMQLVPLGAIEIPKGKALQFWTKAEGWDAPISLGLVKKGESLKIAIDQLPPLTENQLFELTLEEETGSPTGLPTGPIKSIGRGVVTF